MLQIATLHFSLANQAFEQIWHGALLHSKIVSRASTSPLSHYYRVHFFTVGARGHHLVSSWFFFKATELLV